MADQRDDHSEENTQQTVLLPMIGWPTAEPDQVTTELRQPPSDGDHSDAPAGPQPAPPDGVTVPIQAPGAQPAPPGGVTVPIQAPDVQPAPPDGVTVPIQAPGAQAAPTSQLLKRAGLVAAGLLGAIALLYGVDLLLSRGELPRGVTVAGVDVGGLDRASAQQRLRDEVGPRSSEPVAVRAGDVEATVDPADAGLGLDWAATIDAAGGQPLNPWTRLRSLFTTRELGAVTRTDQDALAREVEALRSKTDREPAEGTIRFDGTTPIAVDPKPGQRLDAARAADALVAEWVYGRAVELPVTTTPVRTTPAGVHDALETIAKPAVAGPVTITGEGAQATLSPAVIATALSFEPSEGGGLAAKLDPAKITEALRPQLAPTEQPGKDATIALEGGRPVVKPSVDGRGVEWQQTLVPLLDVLKRTDDRKLQATYSHQPAKFTTDQANALGVKEVIGEFTTRGFARDSGVNIRAIAAEVNGALVKPGELFSLNGFTGVRGAAQGYVEAGIIDNGRPGRAIGGGCSQFATTLFNASYFAGMTDVEHKEHSYFISRYPEAREATVFMNPDGSSVIDVKFRNETPTGILIQTIWTPSDITVRIWGTKHYSIESITSGRSNFTSPNTVNIPPGEPCSPTGGAQGFTVSNTRIVRDASTGREIKRNTRTAVYNPLPRVVCGAESPPS